MNLHTKEYLHSPHIGLRTTREMPIGRLDDAPQNMIKPKPQPTTAQELQVKKDGKLDTNQLLLLGLGAIIIILFIKK